jgi:hypothetical protein
VDASWDELRIYPSLEHPFLNGSDSCPRLNNAALSRPGDVTVRVQAPDPIARFLALGGEWAVTKIRGISSGCVRVKGAHDLDPTDTKV